VNADETTRTLRKLLGVGGREWLTIAAIVRDYPDLFPTTEACRKWLHRHEVPCAYRGRKVIVDRRDLESRFTRHPARLKATG